MPESDILKIAVTGNIGSGKSQFCRYLTEFDQEVISADVVASEILMQREKTWRERWGEGVFTDGQLDRAKIADIVFQDPSELKYLNSIIHPLVMVRFANYLRDSKRQALFFEIPLLFEAKLQDYFDFLILVTCSRNLVLQRLSLRNPGELENLILRLDRQIPDAQKAGMVDLVISNDGELAELKQQARAAVEMLPQIRHRETSPWPHPESTRAGIL